jgi:hypothetical protein
MKSFFIASQQTNYLIYLLIGGTIRGTTLTLEFKKYHPPDYYIIYVWPSDCNIKRGIAWPTRACRPLHGLSCFNLPSGLPEPGPHAWPSHDVQSPPAGWPNVRTCHACPIPTMPDWSLLSRSEEISITSDYALRFAGHGHHHIRFR